MSSEGYQLSAAERQLAADSERLSQFRVGTTEEYQARADAMNVAAGRAPLYSQPGIGPTLNSAGNLSIGSLYQDVGSAATDAFNAIAGGLVNGAAGIVAGVTDVIGGIADIPNQIFGKFAKQPSSPKYGMSERGTTTQGAGTTTSVKQDIAQNTAIPDKLAYPLNQSSRFKFAIQISEYVKPDPLSKPKKKTEANIFLPIPNNLVDRFSVDLQDVQLGAMTNKLASEVSGQLTSGASLEARMSELGSKINTTNAKEVGLDILKRFGLEALQTAGQAIGVDPQAIVSTTLGVAVNPGAAVMFKGVRIRPDHTFQWRLTPRNSAEAEQIKKIIGKLRRSMLPSVDSAAGLVFNYPSVFNIAILPEDNPMFPKYKTCFLEGMEVNYAPTGPSFHGDNVPTEIDLKLTFQELVIFTANDFDKNGNYIEPGMNPMPTDMPPAPTPSSSGSPIPTPEKVATDTVGSLPPTPTITEGMQNRLSSAQKQLRSAPAGSAAQKAASAKYEAAVREMGGPFVGKTGR